MSDNRFGAGKNLSEIVHENLVDMIRISPNPTQRVRDLVHMILPSPLTSFVVKILSI